MILKGALFIAFIWMRLSLAIKSKELAPKNSLPELKHVSYLLKALLAQPRGGTNVAIVAVPTLLHKRTLGVPFRSLDQSRIYLDLNMYFRYRPTGNKHVDKYIELLEDGEYNFPQKEPLPKWISPAWVYSENKRKQSIRRKVPKIYTEKISMQGKHPIYLSFIDNYQIERLKGNHV